MTWYIGLKQQLMKLDTIEVRSKWEALFEQNYISSITKVTETCKESFFINYFYRI